ncbi:hypothetical protein KIPB_014015, partial [Kipferlia bialata]
DKIDLEAAKQKETLKKEAMICAVYHGTTSELSIVDAV